MKSNMKTVETTETTNKKAKKKVASSPFIGILKSDMPWTTKAQLIFRRWKGGLINIPVYFVLIALSFVFLLPFAYVILRSMMTSVDLLNSTMVKWLPRSFNLDNYRLALQSLNYWEKLWTSVWTTGLAVIGQLISCTFVAYGLARIKFKGNGLIFGLVIFTLIVPPQVTIAPTYIMFSSNGFFGSDFFVSLFPELAKNGYNWLESFLPIILPCFFGLGVSGGLFIFIYRQFFRGLPAELENAALIDGCGVFSTYIRIILPNSKPPMLVCLILSLVWQWNNYFEPSMFITQIREYGNLPMQLNVLSDNLGAFGSRMNDAVTMASTFLVMLPIIIVFFLLQNQFMKSIERVGLAN